MEKRRLGRSELTIAPLVLGGNVFGWTADEATSFAILDAFVDAGFNAIDTSDNYSSWIPGHVGGESETVIGAWFKARGRRDEVVLATKIGAVQRAHMEGGQGRGWGGDLSARHLVAAVERSLTRLQTDRIDLCQSHMSDPDTALDETLEAYGRLIEAGKVRVIGASNHDGPTLAAALAASDGAARPRYESSQALYNLYDRTRFEGALRDVCVANDVGVLCYGGLARGFLTGKYRSEADFARSAWRERVEACWTDRGRRILAALEAVSAAHDARPGEVALAWLIVQPGVTAPIAAVNSVAELNEMLGAARLVLTPAQIDALSLASTPEPASADSS